MDGDELGAVGEGRLDLDLVDHVGDAVHHLLAAQHLGAVLHQVGDRAAVARALDDEVADQRHGFGIVELDAALEASARDVGRHGDQQLVLFTRRQIHRSFPPEWLDYKRLHQTCQTRGRRHPRKSVRKRMVAPRTAVASPSRRATITPFTRVTPTRTSSALSRSARAFSKCGGGASQTPITVASAFAAPKPAPLSVSPAIRSVSVQASRPARRTDHESSSRPETKRSPEAARPSTTISQASKAPSGSTSATVRRLSRAPWKTMVSCGNQSSEAPSATRTATSMAQWPPPLAAR